MPPASAAVRVVLLLVIVVAAWSWPVVAPGPAQASIYEYLPVGDPLEDELRTLDVLGPPPGLARLRLPRPRPRNTPARA